MMTKLNTKNKWNKMLRNEMNKKTKSIKINTNNNQISEDQNW
jgi:hypothetical protein